MKTRFLSVNDVRSLVSKVGIHPLSRAITNQIRHDFQRWHEFEKSPRVANHSPIGVIEVMPVSDASRYAFKYVNGHPANFKLGVPTVMAFGCLADVQTGFPLLLTEMTILTGFRTAATSVMAAAALARPHALTMAMIGNGSQSEFQSLAFADQLGIETIHLYDTNPNATKKLLDNLRDTGINFQVKGSVAEAVRGVDIITTSTADKTAATVLTPEMIEPGMHLNAIGGDCPGKTELAADVVRRASVFVEYAPQTRTEGEIQQMPSHFEVTELWEVLSGRHPGRKTNDEVTLFDSVGFAIEDFSTLTVVHALAMEHDLGEDVEIVPNLEDVANLFSLVRPSLVQRSS